MRNGFLIAALLVLAGCNGNDPIDPDTIGIGPVRDPLADSTSGVFGGPIPDTASAAGLAPAGTLQTDRDDLICLMREVRIALAQAPAEGKVAFTGLKVCKLAPGS